MILFEDIKEAGVIGLDEGALVLEAFEASLNNIESKKLDPVTKNATLITFYSYILAAIECSADDNFMGDIQVFKEQLMSAAGLVPFKSSTKAN